MFDVLQEDRNHTRSELAQEPKAKTKGQKGQGTATGTFLSQDCDFCHNSYQHDLGAFNAAYFPAAFASRNSFSSCFRDIQKTVVGYAYWRSYYCVRLALSSI